MKKKGYKFYLTLVDVSLGNGVTKTNEILETRVNVILKNKILSVNFIVLPGQTDNNTLLRVDSINHKEHRTI